MLTTVHTTLERERRASVGSSLYAEYVRVTWPILVRVERDLMEKSQKVICVSHHTASSIARCVPSSRSKLSVLYNAVPEEWFRVERKAAEGLLLYVGRLTERKGLDSLLHAMTQVRSGFPHVKLIIVGRGPLERRLAHAVRQMGLNRNVAFAGSVSDLELLDLYSRVTCFILPSLYEDCPYSLLQAFAAGVPVISTRVGGIPEIVHDNETGLLVPPYDWSALSSAISRVLSDDALRRKLSRNEHTLALQKYRIAAALDSLESVYVEMLRSEDTHVAVT
jgi:glycosyltransferase involved in cell wall biosynthesis